MCATLLIRSHPYPTMSHAICACHRPAVKRKADEAVAAVVAEEKSEPKKSKKDKKEKAAPVVEEPVAAVADDETPKEKKKKSKKVKEEEVVLPKKSKKEVVAPSPVEESSSSSSPEEEPASNGKSKKGKKATPAPFQRIDPNEKVEGFNMPSHEFDTTVCMPMFKHYSPALSFTHNDCNHVTCGRYRSWVVVQHGVQRQMRN